MFNFKETQHAFINTLVRGDISSLTWVESPYQFWSFHPKRQPSQHLCAVYYAPLNFRDVMIATGRLSVDAIPGMTSVMSCFVIQILEDSISR